MGDATADAVPAGHLIDAVCGLPFSLSLWNLSLLCACGILFLSFVESFSRPLWVLFVWLVCRPVIINFSMLSSRKVCVISNKVFNKIQSHNYLMILAIFLRFFISLILQLCICIYLSIGEWCPNSLLANSRWIHV